MAAHNTPVFLVNPNSDPVMIVIQGRASMYNSHLIKRYLDQAVEEGRRRFAFDFSACDSVDSTFLGTVKGVATRLLGLNPPGSIVFCRLSGRNLDNVRNVGLDCLAILACDEDAPCADDVMVPLEGPQMSREEFREVVRKAHEALASDPRVRGLFQDVNSFLRQDPGPK